MLTIGILQADELRDELKPPYGCYADMFKHLLGKENFNYNIYDVRNNEYPDSIDECDGYLVTGSRHGVYDNLSWLPPLFRFIQNLYGIKKPLVGICFGHQAIAKALGGHVEKSSMGWGTSFQKWNIIQAAPWMNNTSSSLSLLSMFQDQVITLPPNAQQIAENAHCKNAAFFIDNHVFCVQGHPEFDSEFMLALMAYRQNDISEEAMTTALNTATYPNDSELCAQWIVEFFWQAQ